MYKYIEFRAKDAIETLKLYSPCNHSKKTAWKIWAQKIPRAVLQIIGFYLLELNKVELPWFNSEGIKGRGMH